MRIRKRYMLLAFASVAALAVGGVAHAITDNVSTLSGSKICLSGTSCTSIALPRDTYKPASLFIHTGTVYAHPAEASLCGKAATVTLYFDDDGKLNLTGIPKCTATFNAGTTIAQAWERCGPGADTAPEVNAYMSPPNAVSGRVSTSPPSNFNGCSLTFNGPTVGGNPTVLLFSRVTLQPNGTANCSNMATNSTGNTTVLLTGTITDMPASSDFGKKLRVPNIDAAPVPLDDYTAVTKRASVISARCHDTNKILNIKATFQYSGTGQPTDTVNKTQPCTIG
jgi:hypothetical protein